MVSDVAKPMNLDEFFRQFNAKYFESQLPIFSVEYTGDLQENSMGHLDCENKRILIRKGLCDSQQQITLLHEMIHTGIKGHGVDFQAKLDHCANNSSPGFREEILSELQRVKDLDRFDCMDRYTWVEGQLTLLATEKSGRPWAEIKPCIFEASRLSASEFAEMEKWISALWDFYCGLTDRRPPAPAGGKKKDIEHP